MIYENIITKEFIDQNIRPFSPTDSLFNAVTTEVIVLDLNDLRGDLHSKLQNDESLGQDLDTQQLHRLQLVMGYFIYSRALRTCQATISKYGATVKNVAESYSADQEKIVADSTYYKQTAETLLKQLFIDYPELKKDCSKCDAKRNTYDQYLKCKVIGQ